MAEEERKKNTVLSNNIYNLKFNLQNFTFLNPGQEIVGMYYILLMVKHLIIHISVISNDKLH